MLIIGVGNLKENLMIYIFEFFSCAKIFYLYKDNFCLIILACLDFI